MRLDDTVYGPIDLDDPVLVALIRSAPLERLRGISQAGFPEPYFPGSDHTRFEHSVGVCHLLRRFGAPRAEQVAGLLHDVSHAAFSHCVDYALDGWDGGEQGFQDAQQARFITAPPLATILAQHGIAAADLLIEERFPLCEQPLPDLCADRIDYILRTGVHTGTIDRAGAAAFLDTLAAEDGRWVMRDAAVARRFAEYFAHINATYYCGRPSAAMHWTVGDLLRHALRTGVLDTAALFTTDAEVLAAIRPHLEHDAELARRWRRMHGAVAVDDGDIEVRCKSRAIDPQVRGGRRLSELDPGWAEILARESVPRTYRFSS